MRCHQFGFAALAAALASSASAGTLALHSGSGSTPISSTSPGDYYYNDGTVRVRVSAWSIDPGGTVRAASIGRWDYGLGVQHGAFDPPGSAYYGSDGNHTTDNKGWKDFLVFQFDKSVELVDGWFYSDWDGLWDTDATIGRGSAFSLYTTPPALAGTSFAGLGSLFTLTPSYDNTGNESGSPDLSKRDINAGNFAATTWLIGASFDANYHDGNKDGFKLRKLTYNVAPPVPEPSTWALLILGFGGVGAAMRRRRQPAAVFA